MHLTTGASPLGGHCQRFSWRLEQSVGGWLRVPVQGSDVSMNRCAAHKSFLMKIKYPKKKFHYQWSEQIMHK